MTDALILCRWCHFASVMLLFGIAVGAVLPGFAEIKGAAYRLARWAAWVAWGSGVLWLLLVTTLLAENWQAALHLTTIGAVLDETWFGQVWRWRLLLAAVLVFAPGRLRAWGGCVLLASLALTGHLAAAGWGQAANQAVHLLAAGAWLGGLVPLWLILRHAPSVVAIRAVRRFSTLGLAAVSLIVLSGTINAAVLVGSASGLTQTAYGRVLLLKTALVLGMGAIACANRMVLAPRLSARPAPGSRALRASVLGELALGLCVLGAASVLGTLPPPD